MRKDPHQFQQTQEDLYSPVMPETIMKLQLLRKTILRVLIRSLPKHIGLLPEWLEQLTANLCPGHMNQALEQALWSP